MIRDLLDKHPDTSIRVLFSACVVGIAISLVFAIWRIQLAVTENRELRAYTIKRDAELWPIIKEIRGNVDRNREFMGRVDDYMRRRDAEIAKRDGRSKQ